ncbi:MAG: AAA family ATPase, partial [Desulfosalsimonas sp.]
DEIDKIAGNKQHYGTDVSRTGVQRALLKPMEETEVELKAQNDPISMIQEVEQFRKTGKREKRSINTRNILFIVSGAFSELPEIIKERTTEQSIGFGARIEENRDDSAKLHQVKAEDLVEYGFESEFIGRLPVRSVFERLCQQDLFEILKNPNNPIILSKRLDFSTYGIDIRFSDEVLQMFARMAYEEKTGARGLVSVIEQALIPFETRLPSINVKRFAVTPELIREPGKAIENLVSGKNSAEGDKTFEQVAEQDRNHLISYLGENKKMLSEQYELALSPYRMELIADYYWSHVVETGTAISRIKTHYDMIKKIEINFYNRHDLNLVLEEDAVDFISEQMAKQSLNIDQIYRKIADDFEYGLKLIRDKTGKNRFFISKYALEQPEAFLENLIKTEFARHNITPDFEDSPARR